MKGKLIFEVTVLLCVMPLVLDIVLFKWQELLFHGASVLAASWMDIHLKRILRLTVIGAARWRGALKMARLNRRVKRRVKSARYNRRVKIGAL